MIYLDALLAAEEHAVSDPVKTVTTVQQVDANGTVISETVTTVEQVVQPEPPKTGMYL